MNYLCPKCNQIMYCISTASIPAITTYQCPSCGYASKPDKERLDYVTLPPWLWSEEDEDIENRDNDSDRI